MTDSLFTFLHPLSHFSHFPVVVQFEFSGPLILLPRMSSLGHEKENDRPHSKDQIPHTETPAERGLLPSRLSNGAGDDSSERAIRCTASDVTAAHEPALGAVLVFLL
jgi:hypothetical protein